MARAYRGHGYTLRQIADEAGLHHGTVSRIIKAREEAGYAKYKIARMIPRTNIRHI